MGPNRKLSTVLTGSAVREHGASFPPGVFRSWTGGREGALGRACSRQHFVADTIKDFEETRERQE